MKWHRLKLQRSKWHHSKSRLSKWRTSKWHSAARSLSPPVLVLSLFLLPGVAPVLAQETAEELYQAGLYQEEVQGNLERAIDLFGRILIRFPDARALGARAQLHIGLCYEKLGQQEAQQAYRRVIADFPEHAAEVALARNRLAEIERAAAELNLEPRFERIEIPAMPKTGVLSPDGNHLAFVADGAVWKVPVQGNVAEGVAGTPERIATIPDAWDNSGVLTWSADGRWIAVNGDGRIPERGDDVVHVVPAEGGDPRMVQVPDRGLHPFAYRLSLSPEGGTLAFSALKESQVEGPNETEKRIIFTVAVDGGEPRPLAEMWARMPAFSPDGKSIAYVAARQAPSDSVWGGDLWVVPAGGGAPVKIATSDPGRFRGPVWSPDGRYIAVNHEPGKNNRSQELWILRADSPEPGPPVAKIPLPGVSVTMPAGWTRDGRIGVFTEPPLDWGAGYTVSAEGGRAGRVTPNGGWPVFLEWSPDGERIFMAWHPWGAPNTTALPNESSIVSIPPSGGEVSEIPLGLGRDVSLAGAIGFDFSPDGNSMVFMGSPSPYAGRPGPEDVGIWTASLDGSGLSELTRGPHFDTYSSWSPDGRWIAFLRLSEEDDYDSGHVFLVPASGGEGRQLTSAQDPVVPGRVAFAPDGSTVAFFSEDGIKTVPVAGGEASLVVPIDSVSAWPQLSWSPDGKKIVYTPGEDRKIWVASVETGQSIELETGLPLDMGYFSVSWSPDGKRIAFNGRRTGREVDFWLISDFLPGEEGR
jgi:Tol biopolymer transport system component